MHVGHGRRVMIGQGGRTSCERGPQHMPTLKHVANEERGVSFRERAPTCK
jgi:hypothetical protein